MNKKFVLVIISAVLLALVISLIMSNNEPRQPKLLKDDGKQEVIEEINFKIESQPIEQPKEESVKSEANNKSDKIIKPVCGKKKFPSVSIEKKASDSVDPQIKIEHVKEAVNIVPNTTEDNIKEASSIQEETSNDIEITTEYKFQSPAKYSFK